MAESEAPSRVTIDPAGVRRPRHAWTWVDGRATGLVDWDLCYPGPRRHDGMADLVLEVRHRTLALERELAAAGVEPQAGWAAAGHPAEVEASIDWVGRHRHLFG